jgi:hypothetical protein
MPIIGDGDTGYGNALNVRRTVRGYAAAGFAGILIEDQVGGWTRGTRLGPAGAPGGGALPGKFGGGGWGGAAGACRGRACQGYRGWESLPGAVRLWATGAPPLP